MNRILKIFDSLAVTDAQPIANCLAVMMIVFGLIAGARVYSATLPYSYSVQCKAPVDGQSHIVLTSRRTGLTTVGPVPDARGAAAVTSDHNHDYYDITLEDSPCRYVEPR